MHASYNLEHPQYNLNINISHGGLEHYRKCYLPGTFQGSKKGYLLNTLVQCSDSHYKLVSGLSVVLICDIVRFMKFCVFSCQNSDIASSAFLIFSYDLCMVK